MLKNKFNYLFLVLATLGISGLNARLPQAPELVVLNTALKASSALDQLYALEQALKVAEEIDRAIQAQRQQQEIDNLVNSLLHDVSPFSDMLLAQVDIAMWLIENSLRNKQGQNINVNDVSALAGFIQKKTQDAENKIMAEAYFQDKLKGGAGYDNLKIQQFTKECNDIFCEVMESLDPRVLKKYETYKASK